MKMSTLKFTSLACAIIIITLSSCSGGKGSGESSPQIENGTNNITATSGGTVTYNNEVKLTIPVNSLPTDSVISIEPVTEIPAGGADDLVPFGQAYKCSPAGTTFDLSNPAVMEIEYDEALLASKNYSPDTLGIYYYDEEIKEYVAVESYVDTVKKKVTAYIEHFTIYLPMARAKVAGNNKPVVSLLAPVPNPIRIGAPIFLRATVRDYDGSLAGVRVYYRKLYPSASVWSSSIMTRGGRATTPDSYYFTIPAGYLTASELGTGNDIEFYVKATDNLGAITKGTTRRYDVTKTYNAGSIAITPATLSIAVGFETYFTVKGSDNSGTAFQFIPETASLLLGKGTLADHGTTGILFHADSPTSEGITERVTFTVGSDTASTDIKICNGELKKVEILDTTGNSIIGTLSSEKGSIYNFDAVGYDEFGNKIPVLPVWSADASIGSIDSNGSFTAGGTGSGNVYIELGEHKDEQKMKILTGVESTSPANNETNVNKNRTVQINFTYPVDDSTVDDESIVIKRVQGTNEYAVPGSFSTSGSVVTFTSTSALISNALYRVEVKGSVEDSEDNPVVPYTFTFRAEIIDSGELETMFMQPNNSLSTFGDWGATSVTTGDFNGDGLTDLALAAGNNVRIHTGRGDGTFSSGVNYAAANYPHYITTGDFNGDSKTDLAVVSGSRVSIFTGRGDGTFNTEVSYAVGWDLKSIAIADFNGDGKSDIAVADSDTYSGGVSILTGRGDGTFNAAVSCLSGAGAMSVTTGDFNGDSKTDLAVTCNNNISIFISIFTGRGDGTFNTAVNYACNFAETLTTGDFNGDNKTDLAVAGNNNTGIFIGRGDGTFNDAVSYTVGLGRKTIATGDFNSDGNLDLLVGNRREAWDAMGYSSDDVSVLIGNGDGTFKTSVNYVACSALKSVAIGDFNCDGKTDIVVAGALFYKDVRIITGKGDGTFNSAVNNSVGATYSTMTADFNGDGKADICTGSSIFTGKGDGTFNSGIICPIYARIIADFNGDAKPDIASFVGLEQNGVKTSTVYIATGKGDGTFDNAVSYTISNIILISMTTADFNHDGITDIAAVGYVNSQSSDGTVFIFTGRGDGTFNTAVNYLVSNGPRSIAAGDFNGDGFADLAVGGGGSVIILTGKNDGTFNNGFSFDGLYGSVDSLISCDFNNDGLADLAGIGYILDYSFTLISKGDGTFTNTGGCAVAFGPSSIIKGDFNADGITDLAVSNNADESWNSVCSISISTGKGDGTFNNEYKYAAVSGSKSMTSADFNGDGRTDIATSSLNGFVILLHK